ncbi:hypothetical protein ACH5RR_003072 [Cinchona calisaya]|uniref:Uncharacterized protein n=1 Tax=Cinchona calisaya TaxID=153742 RepID=A0ABD3ATU5_9GENT
MCITSEEVSREMNQESWNNSNLNSTSLTVTLVQKVTEEDGVTLQNKGPIMKREEQLVLTGYRREQQNDPKNKNQSDKTKGSHSKMRILPFTLREPCTDISNRMQVDETLGKRKTRNFEEETTMEIEISENLKRLKEYRRTELNLTSEKGEGTNLFWPPSDQ